MLDFMQTVCKQCDQDIEGPTDGRWSDRGGNTSCDGDRYHQPDETALQVLENNARLLTKAKSIAAIASRWCDGDAETTKMIERFGGAAQQVIVLKNEDDPKWAVFEKELAQLVTHHCHSHGLCGTNEIPDPEIRESLRAGMDRAHISADFQWDTAAGVADWLAEQVDGIADGFWWMGEYEAVLPQTLFYALVYFVGYSNVWNDDEALTK